MKNVKRILFKTLICLFILLSTGCDKKTNVQVEVAADPAAGGGHAEGRIEWVTDWEKAKRTAAAENKDLLIDFAGSDWCYWCKKLDSEVFTKPEFAAAANDFVFVLVDFPNDKSGQSAALQEQNDQLGREFGVRGFPTIFLAGADGTPYAQTGYRDGGPAAYLEHLEDLKKQKITP